MHSTKKPAKPMNETEARAKAIVLAYERKRIKATMGEEAAKEIREVGEGGGYEIVSPDGRLIEVKGTKGEDANYAFVINSERELNHIENGGLVYRVTNVFGASPRIYILSKEHLRILPRYRADVRIVRGADHEVVIHTEEAIP